MRDDFTEEVKRSLAARVNYLCSNPECRAQTAGPRVDSAKSINIGVAAHITSAAPSGPRYNPLLSTEQRCHFDNGIWLCQNCAKMIDNDVLRFTEKLLRTWKTHAEDHARNSLGKTAAVGIQSTTVFQPAESESERKRRAILPWKEKWVTLSIMSTGRAVMLIGPVYGTSTVQVRDCTEFYVVIGGNDWSRSISLTNIEIAFDTANNRLELQERHV